MILPLNLTSNSCLTCVVMTLSTNDTLQRQKLGGYMGAGQWIPALRGGDITSL